jgi:acyl transferase domain-containing protein
LLGREVAVDVASHSPQVDPILDELAEVLADLSPMEPEVPYYSATLYDPRDIADCDADYWVDNLRHTVRFAAAVQAALEDGHRVFAELSPHPLLTHAFEQTARTLDTPSAVLAGMRRQQEMPHGLRGLVADLHSVGATVDFSVLYPAGRPVDAPLPTWTHTSLLLDRDGHDVTSRGACTVSVHPLLGSHVAVPDEPERHLWQGEVGTDAQPWLADHQVHEVAVLPGAAYCEMALAAARAVFGDTSEVRDLSFEQMLLLDQKTPVAASASVVSPGVSAFAVETYQAGERTQRANAVLRADVAADEPQAHDVPDLLAAHDVGVDGADLRAGLTCRLGGARMAGFGGIPGHDGALGSPVVNRAQEHALSLSCS